MKNKVTLLTPFSPFFNLFVFSILFISSCDSTQERESKVLTYYDLKGFIETQIVSLNKEKPQVVKMMRVSEKNEKRISNDLDWKKELELFIQADINKPAYSKSYTISKPDSSTILYILKAGESLPVRFIKLTLDKTSGNPVTIEAQLHSENKLYESEKDIMLHGSVTGNKWYLKDYSIQGFQKLATMNKKAFDVTAHVQRQ